ncbi:hypothetical protein ACQP1K_12165 [Sphaerimonospora sp. CA-214678]
MTYAADAEPHDLFQGSGVTGSDEVAHLNVLRVGRPHKTWTER